VKENFLICHTLYVPELTGKVSLLNKMCRLLCFQDEYATAADRQVGPLTTNSTQFHGQSHRTLCNTTELSSSLPYGLNSRPQPAVRLPQRDAGRLLQHSHSLPSSPHKLRPQQLSVQSPLCVYPAGGSFADLSYNMAEKTTTNRSKVLPKEVCTLV